MMLFSKLQSLFHAAAVVVVSLTLRAMAISFLAIFPKDGITSVPFLHLALGNGTSAQVTITSTNDLQCLDLEVTFDIDSVVYETIELNSSIILQASQKYENVGILIESDGDITVLAETRRIWSYYASNGVGTASFLLSPVSSLGTSYVTVTMCSKNHCVVVVASPQDDTSVTIGLVAIRNDVPGSVTYNRVVYSHGDVLVEVLNAYDSLQLLGDLTDLTGTTVTSTRPVAVISGGDFDHVTGTKKDALMEQMPAVEDLGTTHFLSGFQNWTAYSALIVFTDGDTHVAYHPIGDVEIIKEDDYKQYVNVDNSHTAVEVISNRPVLVALISPADQDNLPFISPDLSMVIIMPHSKWSQSYYAPLFRRTLATENYLDLIALRNCSHDFLLNGAPLRGVSWRFSDHLKTTFIDLSSINGSFTISNPECTFSGYVSGVDGPRAWAFSLAVGGQAPRDNNTQPLLCPCSCESDMSWIKHLTPEETENMRKAIVEDLQVDVQALSSTKRRKTSAENKEPSSSYTGIAITVVVFLSVLSIIVVGDVLSIVAFFIP